MAHGGQILKDKAGLASTTCTNHQQHCLGDRQLDKRKASACTTDEFSTSTDGSTRAWLEHASAHKDLPARLRARTMMSLLITQSSSLDRDSNSCALATRSAYKHTGGKWRRVQPLEVVGSDEKGRLPSRAEQN
jgi:hypothetical protein